MPDRAGPPTSAMRGLWRHLKRERERLAQVRRGGFFPSDAMRQIKQHVWVTCNRPPFIASDGGPYPDTQAIIDANSRYMNQRGDPKELDRMIRAVEKIGPAACECHADDSGRTGGLV